VALGNIEMLPGRVLILQKKKLKSLYTFRGCTHEKSDIVRKKQMENLVITWLN